MRLQLTIPSEKIKALTGAEGLIRVEGQVTRSTPEGMAVQFDNAYEFVSFKGLRSSRATD